MRIIQTADLTPQTPLTTLERELIYNGLDCCVTHEVLGVLLQQLDPISQKTYDFSRALQAPILDMSMRGVRVDLNKRAAVLTDIRIKIDQIAANLTRLVTEGIGVEINWRSNAQLKSLFYDVMGLAPIRKRNSNGQFTPTVNRDAIERLQQYYYAEPICVHLLALRDLDKKRQFLETELDSDGRIRCNFNIAGTNTGRLASSFSDFGTGCVRPSAEALTPTGWKKIGNLLNGDSIAQWYDGVISFVPANFHWTDFNGELLQFETEQTKLAVTPEHRITYRLYHSSYKTNSARSLIGSHQIYIPISGNFLGGTKLIPPYAAMLMADFSKEETQWRGAFKKQRKIDRFLELAEIHNIEFNEIKAKEDYRRFSIKGEQHCPKKWGPWVLELTPESATALVEEAAYWDAHIRGKSFIFYTADKEQALWFQTLCHLVGKGTTLNASINSDEAYGNNSFIYSVNVKPRDEVQVLRRHWKRIKYSGKVGCPIVPSSYWLVKEDGYISVTGNTNLQNVDRELRSIFIADEGYKFCNVDLEQGDSRNVGAILWNQFIEPSGDNFAGAYLDACESGDLHTTVAKLVWPDMGWTGDKTNDRKIADATFYRQDSFRQTSKKLGHATNFYGQAPHIAKQTRVPTDLVAGFQRGYFQAFPAIGVFDKSDHITDTWQSRTRLQLRQYGFITTLLGRRRFFFGRSSDDETIRGAIAFEPQSLTADEIDTGLLRLWRADRVQLLLQVHDSILFQFPEEQEDEIIPWALDLMKVTIPLKRGRDFYVPVEAKTGWNWREVLYWTDDDLKKGLCSQELVGTVRANPDGIKKWQGADPRKRQDQISTLSIRRLVG